MLVLGRIKMISSSWRHDQPRKGCIPTSISTFNSKAPHPRLHRVRLPDHATGLILRGKTNSQVSRAVSLNKSLMKCRTAGLHWPKFAATHVFFLNNYTPQQLHGWRVVRFNKKNTDSLIGWSWHQWYSPLFSQAAHFESVQATATQRQLHRFLFGLFITT